MKDRIVNEPDNLLLRVQLASLLLEVEDFDSAGKQIELIQKLEPQHPDLELLKNILQQKISDHKDSAEIEEIDSKATIEVHHFTAQSQTREEAQWENTGQTKLGRDLEQTKINFDQIGGMENLKHEVNIKFIQPLRNPELFAKFGKQPGGAMLLFGPPGCGKTFFSRAVAGQIEANFINVGLHQILDMYIGNSEKNMAAIFEQARRTKPTVIFFDELDAIGSERSRNSHSNGLVNQMLIEMDGLHAGNQSVFIIGATNMPWNLDTALKRPGRFDLILFVAPPDLSARKEILNLYLKDLPIENVDLQRLAELTDLHSGADLLHIVSQASESVLHNILKTGKDQKVTQADLERQIKAHTPSTLEWFSNMKNYARFQNQGGYYDQVISYMESKRLL